jgi:two-component system, chemotaxis family, chemotaxis protein CheY
MARILTVDDSSSIRQMVALTLRSACHVVEEAADGVAALTRCQSERYDAVIADVCMPNMDGLTLVRRLRELPLYRHTPILMLTTEAGEAHKQQGRDAGATGWLVKPFDPGRLLQILARVLV